MSLFVKLIVSLVVAVIAYSLASILITGGVQLTDRVFGLQVLIAFFIATTATALIVRDKSSAAPSSSARSSNTRKADDSPAMDNGDREDGKVKWFNVSKGFGFIIKDDGEEIFVHFRSIRGEGRRGLRDGQRVSFVVAESDKGPQAEDVVGEE